MSDTAEPVSGPSITIESGGGKVFAVLEVNGTSVIASEWAYTTEAALVGLCEKARAELEKLGRMSAKAVREDGKDDLYLCLVRTFRG